MTISGVFVVLGAALAVLSVFTARQFWVVAGLSAGFLLLGMVTAVYAGDTYVRDGDTIVVDGTPVRLKGLSCAELGSGLGDFQRTFLVGWMARSKEVSCTLTSEKTYDRQVGWCSLDGFDIGHGMISAAYCQPCRRYDSDGRYAHLPVTRSVPKYCEER